MTTGIITSHVISINKEYIKTVETFIKLLII